MDTLPSMYDLVPVTTRKDWETLHRIRSAIFGKEEGEIQDEDRYVGHFPMLFLCERECIGTLRIDLVFSSRATIFSFGILKEKRHSGHGRALMWKCGKFALERNVGKLLLESEPSAEGFYAKLGFIRERWGMRTTPTGVLMTKVIHAFAEKKAVPAS